MLLTISPAQQAYIDAIQRCSQTKPELLIAHSYVRYLGDLSGGQILAKKLQKYNDLPEGKGVAFYQFVNIEDVNEFKEAFRIRLSQVEIDEETRQAIIEESCQAFIRNADLFQEFDDELDEQEAVEAQIKAQAQARAQVQADANDSVPIGFLRRFVSAVGLT